MNYDIIGANTQRHQPDDPGPDTYGQGKSMRRVGEDTAIFAVLTLTLVIGVIAFGLMALFQYSTGIDLGFKL